MAFGLLAVIGAMVLMTIQSAVDDIAELGDEIITEGNNTAGSNGDDVIEGNAEPNYILPSSGNDVVDAGAGNDTISDYTLGAEKVRSDAGLVNGNWSDDTIYGGEGNDVILATGGADWVDGGPGDDRINTLDLHPDSPYAPDHVDGGSGDDWLVGNDGDTLIGGTGTDFFTNLIEDHNDDSAVVVEDFQPGEVMELLIYDRALLPADGSDPVGELRDGPDGAILSVNGYDAVVFRDSLAKDLNGDIRVLDGRSL
ncbi:calcium-binding protein [Sagittula sp. S175]|uniref:calcium-binding protein n=1 Tax=Sagittula sp. S175 TaxID=3415129 RepID=UPI003C79B8B0